MFLGRPAVLALAVAASLAACKVHNGKRGFRIGSGCEKMDESCANGSSANLCRDNALALFSCKGPKGCVDAPPDDVACDQTVAEEKDPCTSHGFACTSAKDALLECQSGVFTKTATCASHVCAITATNVAGTVMTRTACN